MKPTVYLSVDQIKDLHRTALEEFGGLDGVRSEQALFSAIAQVQQSAFGEDAYSTIPEKAAAYGYFLAQNQPFLDGNKRTGLAAMIAFLDVNGYELIDTEDHEAEMFEELGAGVVNQTAFFDWVRQHAHPIDPIRLIKAQNE